MTIGDTTNTDSVNVVLSGGTRTLNTASGENLVIANVVSGGQALKAAGSGAVTLDGANTYNGGLTLSSGQLNLNNAGAIGNGSLTISGSPTIDNTSGSPITLNNNQAWNSDFTFAGSNLLSLGGTVTLGANPTITVSASTLTVSGVIGGSSHTLKKVGPGMLTLSGTNTFNGMTLAGGQLNINNNAAVGAGSFTINGSTNANTIDNTSLAPVTLTNNNAQTWNGSFTFAGSYPLNLGSGAVTLSLSPTVTVSGNTLTVGGIISGAHILTKAGSGTLVVTGANTYSGGTTISGGTLSFANSSLGSGNITFSGSSSTLQWNGSNTQDVSSGIQAITTGNIATFDTNGNNVTLASVLSGAGGIAKVGADALTLSAANTYSGGTTISAGTLSFANSSLGSGNITFSGNSTLQWNGSNTQDVSSKIQAIGTGLTATLNTNGNNVTLASVLSGAGGIAKVGTGALTLSATNTYSGGTTISGGTVSFANSSLGTGNIAFSASSTLQWNGSNTQDVSNEIQAIGTGVTATLDTNGNYVTLASVLSGAGGIAKVGTGALTLSAANTYSGGTTISGGTLSFANSSLGSGNITFSASSTLQWNGSNTQDVSSKIQAIGSGVTATLDTNGNNVTLASVLSGAGSVTKAGTGTLLLNGANTFSGTLSINTGIIQLGNTNSAQSSTVSLGVTNGLMFTSGITNFTIGGLAGSANELLADTASVAVALTVGNTASSNTYSGILSGTGSLKIIAAIEALSGANTYSGGTTLTTGATLDINNAAALGTGPWTISGSPTIDNTSGSSIILYNNQNWNSNFTFTGTNPLDFETGTVTLGANPQITVSANTLTVGGVIGGSSHTLKKIGPGTLTLSGANTFNGMTLMGGQLNINNGAPIGAGSFTINGSSDANTIGNTSGTTITLTNNNAQTWNSSFTFAGTSNLDMGNGAVSLSLNPTVTVSGSTLLTVGGIISGAHNLTKAGVGTLVLSGANIYSGSTTVSAGTMLVNDSSGSGTGTGPVTVNGGATLGGTGTASGAVTVISGGNLSPGSGGTSIFNTGNLVLASGSNLNIVLNGNTVGSQYDQVYVTGTVSVGGSNLNLSGSRSAHDGSVLEIIANDASDAVTGTFTGLGEGGTTVFNAVTYTATYLGGTGNDVALTADSATTTSVSSSANPSTYDSSVTFTATVSSASGTPYGTVTFEDGTGTLGTGTLNGAGQATLSTSLLSIGSHSITVDYSGNSAFVGSTSSVLTETEALPDLPSYNPSTSVPSSNPTPPSWSDVFNPPTASVSLASTFVPAIATSSVAAGPDDTITLTGSAFTDDSGNDFADTRFIIYGQTGSGDATTADAQIQDPSTYGILATIPSSEPANSMYLVWPLNSSGVGSPVAVNRTQATWMDPSTADSTTTVSVYGRNLSNGTSAQSSVYLQPGSGSGYWATVTNVNPYRVQFTLPSGLATGSYRVWVYNGLGGQYGWSECPTGPTDPTGLTVVASTSPWGSTPVDVTTYIPMGATNDGPYIQSAINALPTDGTLYFLAGTYNINNNITQYLDVLGSGLGGTYTLGYSGQTTSALAYNASASTIAAALNALSSISGAGSATVTGSAGAFTITFSFVNTASLTINIGGLTGVGNAFVQGSGSLILPSNVRLEGAGMNSSIIQFSGNIPNDGGGPYDIGFNDYAHTNVELDSIGLVYNGPPATNAFGEVVRERDSSGLVFNDVQIVTNDLDTGQCVDAEWDTDFTMTGSTIIGNELYLNQTVNVTLDSDTFLQADLNYGGLSAVGMDSCSNISVTNCGTENYYDYEVAINPSYAYNPLEFGDGRFIHFGYYSTNVATNV